MTATNTNANKSLQASKRGRRVEIIGRVKSDKMAKTISVTVLRTLKHPRYKRFIKRLSVFKAHDEKEQAKVGDWVRIYEVAPISKTKSWLLAEVLQQAEEAVKTAGNVNAVDVEGTAAEQQGEKPS